MYSSTRSKTLSGIYIGRAYHVLTHRNSLCRGVATVSLNGSILGVHRDPDKLVRGFRAARRAGGIGGFVSIYRQQDSVNIASDGGRVCRPLIICEHGVPKVTASHTAKVGLMIYY